MMMNTKSTKATATSWPSAVTIPRNFFKVLVLILFPFLYLFSCFLVPVFRSRLITSPSIRFKFKSDCFATEYGYDSFASSFVTEQIYKSIVIRKYDTFVWYGTSSWDEESKKNETLAYTKKTTSAYWLKECAMHVMSYYVIRMLLQSCANWKLRVYAFVFIPKQRRTGNRTTKMKSFGIIVWYHPKWLRLQLEQQPGLNGNG